MSTSRTRVRHRIIQAILLGLILGTCRSLEATAQTPFYEASPADLSGQPGTLIRQERMPSVPQGGVAYRVLYRSTGLKGESIAVSGVVIVPTRPAPPSGRPVIAWAHPTTGIVSHCAPSLARSLYSQIQGLTDMLDRGYVVTATDYPGLGTAGPHPYLIGISEGRAVLDSVRAARNLVGSTMSNRFALWSHSQGGQAALYAGNLARSYAPELAPVGVAAAAPATDLKTLMKDDMNTAGGNNLLAMTLWSWSRVYNIPLHGIVDPSALPLVNDLANMCLESVIDIFPRRSIGDALMKRFLQVDDLTDREPWRQLLADNEAPALPHRLPVFLSQGNVDDTVRPDVTLAYMDRLCRAGSPVRMLLMSGVGHAFIARDSAKAALDWIGDRFARIQPPSNCSG